jgi:hypothetical protein
MENFLVSQATVQNVSTAWSCIHPCFAAGEYNIVLKAAGGVGNATTCGLKSTGLKQAPQVKCGNYLLVTFHTALMSVRASPLLNPPETQPRKGAVVREEGEA